MADGSFDLLWTWADQLELSENMSRVDVASLIASMMDAARSLPGTTSRGAIALRSRTTIAETVAGPQATDCTSEAVKATSTQLRRRLTVSRASASRNPASAGGRWPSPELSAVDR